VEQQLEQREVDNDGNIAGECCFERRFVIHSRIHFSKLTVSSPSFRSLSEKRTLRVVCVSRRLCGELFFRANSPQRRRVR
jgi:hypothetical protein